MKLSQKTDYAMRAMLDLALNAAPGRLARTAEIARRTAAPEKFLEAILSELRRAGLLESQRGAAGGHRLARSPARITAGDVWRAVDGPIALAVRARRRAGGDAAARALQGLWSGIEAAVQRAADAVSLEDLARRAREVSRVPDFAI